MNPRRVTTILLSLGTAAVIVLLLSALIQRQTDFVIADTPGLILLVGLLIAQVRGFKWTAQVMVTGATLLTVAALPPTPAQNESYVFTVLTPPILAAVLLPWYWSIGAFLVCFTGFAIRWGGQGLLFEPGAMIMLFLQAGGVALASVVARTAQRRAEENAQHAQEALQEAQQQKDELAEQAELLRQQNDAQSRLLDLVSALEIPTVVLADGVLLAPVVGTVDSQRAQALTSRLLNSVSEQHAQHVVLDIAGVTSVDTGVAKALIEATRALRLLGCKVTISGISAAVATTLTHLNITLDDIQTVRSPQEALEQIDGRPRRFL